MYSIVIPTIALNSHNLISIVCHWSVRDHLAFLGDRDVFRHSLAWVVPMSF